MANIIDGKALATKQCDAIKKEAQSLSSSGVVVGLSVILVGDDPASTIYVRNKEKKARELGFEGKVIRYPENVSQDEIISCVRKLNADKSVHGILVQLPLPKHINERAVIDEISPAKDVDGLTTYNMGRLFSGNPQVISCTPRGVIELIKSTGVNISGKDCVVVGRSNIVGKPLSALLLRENATVTACHSYTKNLAEVTSRADILIAAVGKAGLIKADMVKPGAVVIDVGMNRQNDKLCGDVEFDSVKAVAGFITPVPGGVGPMTIAMLMKNTLECAVRSV